MTSVRIILVDDHDLVRAGIRALFEQLPHIEVIGSVRDGQAGLKLIQQERPDIAFIDISMSGMDGLSLIRRAAMLEPQVRLIVLSMYSTESYVFEALTAGACGYLLKQNANLAELQAAIECVMQGGQYLTPAISQKVMEALSRSQQPDARQSLTPRQRDILRLIGEGHSTKEIAYKLSISVKTVDAHRAELMERLRIYDVAGLVRYAIRIGLVDIEDPQ
jgi:DNA-binding NarL/FixJ family response regulator